MRIRLPYFVLSALFSWTTPDSGRAASTITQYAGTGEARTAGEGSTAKGAALHAPFGVVRGPDGAIWFCEYEGHVVRRIGADGLISTVIGTGAAGFSGDGGPALKAPLNHPHEIRFDRDGNLYVADTSNHAIRRWDSRTKVLTTVCGTGKAGYSGDGGPAHRAELNLPISLQLDAQDNIYICDIANHVVRRVDAKTKIVSTFAGTGKAGPTIDGAPFAGSPLNGPRTLDIDPAGNLWLATREGNQVWKLDISLGVFRHIAGTGKRGFSGDAGPARQATLSGPKGLALGPRGRIYLADTDNHAIRRIDPVRGTIETVAGTGKRGAGRDGDPLTSALSQPHALWVDSDETIFIADSLNHRLRVLKGP